jgi:hypothetical protein
MRLLLIVCRFFLLSAVSERFDDTRFGGICPLIGRFFEQALTTESR